MVFLNLSSIGPIFLSPFCLLLLDLVIYFSNVWNETEADNTRERRDFSESSLRPFFYGALQLESWRDEFTMLQRMRKFE